MWQVSRQIPSLGWESRASKYGPKSQVREHSEEPCPAVDSSSRNGSSSRVSSSSSGSMCVRTWARASSRARPPVAEPVWTTTPRAPISLARRSEWRRETTDRSTVASVCEPKLIRYGAWTYAGTESAAHSERNSSSWAGFPGGVAQPRGLATKTCTVSASRARAWPRPTLASPPATGTWPPIGLRMCRQSSVGLQGLGPEGDRGSFGGLLAALDRLAADRVAEGEERAVDLDLESRVLQCAAGLVDVLARDIGDLEHARALGDRQLHGVALGGLRAAAGCLPGDLTLRLGGVDPLGQHLGLQTRLVQRGRGVVDRQAGHIRYVDGAALADDEGDRRVRVPLGARTGIRADDLAPVDLLAELPGRHPRCETPLLQLAPGVGEGEPLHVRHLHGLRAARDHQLHRVVAPDPLPGARIAADHRAAPHRVAVGAFDALQVETLVREAFLGGALGLAQEGGDPGELTRVDVPDARPGPEHQQDGHDRGEHPPPAAEGQRHAPAEPGLGERGPGHLQPAGVVRGALARGDHPGDHARTVLGGVVRLREGLRGHRVELLLGEGLAYHPGRREQGH